MCPLVTPLRPAASREVVGVSWHPPARDRAHSCGRLSQTACLPPSSPRGERSRERKALEWREGQPAS